MKTKMSKKRNSIITNGKKYRKMIDLPYGDVLPPLPQFIYEQLKEEIVSNGISFPFILRELDVIPPRYELASNYPEFDIVSKHNLPFSVIIKNYETNEDVIREIITKTLNRHHLNTFEKGELVLKHEDILTSKGKENMSKGGQGSKISEEDKIDTMTQLSKMIGCSHDTLRKVRYILNSVDPNDEILNQLRSDELSINKAHEEIKSKKDIKVLIDNNLHDFFPSFDDDSYDIDPNTLQVPILSEYKINYDRPKEYQVIFIKPDWDLSDRIGVQNDQFSLLRRLNISEITDKKICTMIIQTPSKYLGETLEILKCWKFNCVDTICVFSSSKHYTSKYSNQNHELLLFCEFDNIGVTNSMVNNRLLTSIIKQEDVNLVITKMFDEKLNKISVFSKSFSDWDYCTFDGSELKIDSNMKAA